MRRRIRTATPRANPNGIKPKAHVLDSRGRIVPHLYEPPHDDPGAGGPCWDCILDEGHPIHRRPIPAT